MMSTPLDYSKFPRWKFRMTRRTFPDISDSEIFQYSIWSHTFDSHRRARIYGFSLANMLKKDHDSRYKFEISLSRYIRDNNKLWWLYRTFTTIEVKYLTYHVFWDNKHLNDSVKEILIHKIHES